MKLTNIDHIGIAVNDIEKALEFWQTQLGIELHGVETVEEQKVKTAFLPVDDTEIELLQATDPESPVAKFIEKKGEGVHHIAIRVDNLEETLAQMKARGVRLIDEKPRLGAGGARIAFLHPKSTGGVLVELCQRD